MIKGLVLVITCLLFGLAMLCFGLSRGENGVGAFWIRAIGGVFFIAGCAGGLIEYLL